MASIDALILALSQFEGTLVFISHDVYFIRELAKKVLHISAGKLTAFAGNYDYFLDKSRATDARAALTAAGFTDERPGGGGQKPKETAPRTGPKSKEQKRAEALARASRAQPLREARSRVQSLERSIADIEKRQSELMDAMERPETYSTPGLAQELNRELGDVVRRLEAATRDWESASLEVERLGGGE
jgi:ATP-binding cassette subfamily F protein 3